jgi:tetratricopeptide (TPR) repeat protein
VLLTLAPSSSFVPINDLMVEYRMYLPLAGVVAAAVGATRGLCARTGVPGFVPLALAAMLLGWTTVRRNRDYLSVEALWASVVEVAPQNMRAHYELGVARFYEGRGDEARTSFERSIELIEQVWAERASGAAPSGVNCETVELRDIAGAFVELGRRDVAPDVRLGDLERAIALSPDDVLAHALRAALLRETGRASEALAGYERVIALAPADPSAREGRGRCLLELDRPAEALEAFHRALTLAPARGSAVFGRARAYRALGRETEARADLRRILRDSPDASLRERAAALMEE